MEALAFSLKLNTRAVYIMNYFECAYNLSNKPEYLKNWFLTHDLFATADLRDDDNKQTC
jgi:hypothetical protein